MRRAQRGVALVLVLWASILLLVVASSFIVERRTEAMVVVNSVSMARAEGAADAGVYRAVYERVPQRQQPRQLEARRHALRVELRRRAGAGRDARRVC